MLCENRSISTGEIGTSCPHRVFFDLLSEIILGADPFKSYIGLSFNWDNCCNSRIYSSQYRGKGSGLASKNSQKINATNLRITEVVARTLGSAVVPMNIARFEIIQNIRTDTGKYIFMGQMTGEAEFTFSTFV